jgi:hypothetical protein
MEDKIIEAYLANEDNYRQGIVLDTTDQEVFLDVLATYGAVGKVHIDGEQIVILINARSPYSLASFIQGKTGIRTRVLLNEK